MVARFCCFVVLAAITWPGVAETCPLQDTRAKPGLVDPSAATLAGLNARVPVGDVVRVTDMAGATVSGRLDAVTADALHVRDKSAIRRLAAADIRCVQWQQRDSVLTGLVLGAGIGAIPGLYWLAVDPNECSGMCPEEYAFIAIGAAVGGLIDRAINKRVTVYRAEPSHSRAKTVTVGPLVARAGKGLRIAVTF
jgi:hypothetical protein